MDIAALRQLGQLIGSWASEQELGRYDSMVAKREAFRDIDDRTEDLRDLANAHPNIWCDFVAQFEYSWIYHENALEGIVLTHAEVTSALRGRPIAPDTYRDIRNMKVAVDLARKEAIDGPRVDMALLRRFHSAFGSDNPDYEPARYRKDIPLHRAYFHEIAQPTVIPTRINDLLEWSANNDPDDDDDAVRFAAHFHHEFMSIFPFAEHTGKTGRLVVNYILMRHGYLPVLFHATERQRYYDTLRLSKKETEQFLIEMMNNTVDNGVRYIRGVLEEQKKRSFRRVG
ncbi:MAG: Fic family protein [Myxococcota bacterium]